jgi:hypothetical protein
VNIPPIDRGQADQFLQLLGKDPSTARLRAFPHRLNPKRHDPKTNPNGIKARAGAYDLAVAGRWQREERGIYLVINDGGDRDDSAVVKGVHKPGITACLAFWVEWDNRPVEWQLQGWREFGLGEPSITVTTGGKSAHLYWVLDQPITPDQWRPIQQALISVTGADPVNKNPSRVMRLPGAYYIGPDGDASGQSRIYASTDRRYSVEEVEDWLADAQLRQVGLVPAARSPAPEAPRGQSLSPGTLPPRPTDALKQALAKIPPFAHSAGQYDQLVGLAMRLHVEIGATAAEQLLAETCCGAITDLPAYFKGTPNQISPGSIWPYLRDQWGIDIRRHDLARNSQELDNQRPDRTPPDQHRTPHPVEPPPLTLDEVREQFRYAVQGGASRQDLEAERIRLADASKIPASTLRDLLNAIQREEESGVQVAQEAQRLAKAITRADGNAGIRLDQIMPPLLADALATRTRYLPSDDLSAIMAFLACVSGVVKLGTELVASHAAAYRVPLNLYVALVARTGAKKSPLSKALVDEPTKALRAELKQHHSRAMAEWTEQNRQVKPSERPDPPAPVFISTSDYTAEALASQLQVHEIRKAALSIHRDELAGLFGSFGRYTGGRGADSEQLLETYDGTGFRSLRVAAANGGRSYERCHLSIWGTIQPEILQGLVASGDASGLWARFGFVPLPPRAVRIADDETQSEVDATDAAAELLAAACRFLYCLPITSLTMDCDARRLFMDYEFQAQEHALIATLPAYGALMGKAAGKVLRIAGLLHLLWSWELGSSPSAPVTIGVVERAILLVDAINQWTVGIHESVAEAGEASDLMRMIHKLAEAASAPIAWRDVAQRLTKAQRREIDSGAAATAVEALAAMGMGMAGTGSRGAWTYQATGSLP